MWLGLSIRNIFKYIQNSHTSQGYIYIIRYLQYFSSNLCNFTDSKMFLSAVVNDFAISWFKIWSSMHVLHYNYLFFSDGGLL